MISRNASSGILNAQMYYSVVNTGANTGIGKETAKDISKRGARVIILCRNIDKAKAAAEEISKETGGAVEVEKLDLSSLKSVRECAQKILEKVRRQVSRNLFIFVTTG